MATTQKLTNDIVYLEKIDKTLLDYYHKKQAANTRHRSVSNQFDDSGSKSWVFGVKESQGVVPGPNRAKNCENKKLAHPIPDFFIFRWAG